MLPDNSVLFTSTPLNHLNPEPQKPRVCTSFLGAGQELHWQIKQNLVGLYLVIVVRLSSWA